MAGGTLEERPSPGVAEAEIERTRQRLGELLAELSRRRHELTDVKLQMRRHVVPLAVAAGALLAGLATLIGVAIHRRRSGHVLALRARRVRQALGRVVAHPELVAKPRPNVGAKVASAAATALVGVVVKAMAQRAVSRVSRPRRALEAHTGRRGWPRARPTARA